MLLVSEPVSVASPFRKPLHGVLAALGDPQAYLFTRPQDGLPWAFMDFYFGYFRPAVQ